MGMGLNVEADGWGRAALTTWERARGWVTLAVNGR